jgi:hypothetical protein
MKTDDLIGLLAADATPPAALRPWRIGVSAMAGIVAVLGLFLAFAGIRPDLAVAVAQPEIAAKTLIPLALFAMSLPLALASLRPDAAVRPMRSLLLPIMAALALWLWSFATLPPALRFAEVSPVSVGECLGLIIGLSILPLGLLLGLMRHGASLAPGRAGAMAGLMIGCGVTAGYSLFCTQDNPLFYVTWYGAAILIVALAGAVLGQRLLRW